MGTETDQVLVPVSRCDHCHFMDKREVEGDQEHWICMKVPISGDDESTALIGIRKWGDYPAIPDWCPFR